MRAWIYVVLLAALSVYVAASPYDNVTQTNSHITYYGGTWTNIANAKDLNWASFATSGANDRFLYMNGTWPHNAVDTQWHTKVQTGGCSGHFNWQCYNHTSKAWLTLDFENAGGTVDYNKTLSVPAECIDRQKTMFRVQSCSASDRYYEGETISNSTHALSTCHDQEERVHTFKLIDKATDTGVNGSIAGFFESYNLSGPLIQEHSLFWEHDLDTYRMCLRPNSSIINASAQIVYEDTDGNYSNTYYFVRNIFGNGSGITNLYFVSGTTKTLFYVIDSYGDPIADALIKVREYDIATKTNTLVEVIRTGSDGSVYGNIILQTQYYTFIIEVDGVAVYETSPTLITSSPRTFRVSTTTNYFVDYESVLGVTGQVSYNNATKIWTYTWNNPTGAQHLGCLRITKQIGAGRTVMNESCVYSSSASITLNQSHDGTYTGTYIGTGYITINSRQYILDTLSHSYNYLHKQWGNEGMFLGAGVIMTLGMIGIASGSIAATIVMVLVGTFFMVLIQLFSLPWTYMVSLVIVGGIVLFIAHKKMRYS